MDRHIGKRLRELREARGLTQESLAERAEMNAKHYARLELNGSMTVATLVRVCTALGVPLSEVFATADLPERTDAKVVKDLTNAIIASGDPARVHRLRRLLEIVFR